jgi:hypothetical protein
MPRSSDHRWVSPAEIADRLEARRHGDRWRAKCPAHATDNPTTLTIREGTDKHGNPVTMLHCFVGCTIEDICAVLGLELSDLFCVRTPYLTGQGTANHTPRTERLKTMHTPSPDDIALIMLEEMILSDPVFLAECPPARQKMWELGQDPRKRDTLNAALREARHNPTIVWDTLGHEYSGA